MSHEQLLQSHENRISVLEGVMNQHSVTLANLERDMRVNNEMTAGIKSDTAELVTLGKGAKIIGKIIAWGGGIATAALVFIELAKYMRGV